MLCSYVAVGVSRCVATQRRKHCRSYSTYFTVIVRLRDNIAVFQRGRHVSIGTESA